MDIFWKIAITTSVLMFQMCSCFSQDFHWWNDKYNWDGITPWQDYMTTSSAFMGPNALPVPSIKNGTIPQNAYFKLSLDNHFSKGDKTENLYSEIHIPLYSDRVGLNIHVVPIEHYEMDASIRDIRRTRNINGEGFAGGDIYIGTFIQLVEKKERLPDVLLTINLRTASGTKLEDARYTNTPGYFFDLSIGKSFNLNEQANKFIKPYSMLGLYVWQLHGLGEYQNDAFLFGLGFDLIFPKLEINNALGGYYGFIGNGDRPLLYRLSFKSKFDTAYNYELGFQQGLHDYKYTSLRLSCIVDITMIKNQIQRNRSY